MTLPEEILKSAEKEIETAKDIKELDSVFRKYLGKGGELALILSSLKNMPIAKKREVGASANEARKKLLEALEKKTTEFNKQYVNKEGWVDITAPGKKPELGHLHPLTLAQRRTADIFQHMGFSIALGPEIENEWYNFDALNIPADHPARDIWNTFWLKPLKGEKMLLRTHTSPVQIRYMENNKPPFRIIAPGRVFRHEASDASHDINFYQIEGLMVDKDISVANFKAIIHEFFQRFFSKSVKIRLRPSYFPFVEPGFEVDMTCLYCAGSGCRICSQSGWLEMIGAGMVHPKVFEAVELNPGEWQGFAFGMGFDRFAMMLYKIDDIRLFYGGDLRFLQQF